LNCVANGRLLREGPFDGLWIQPAAGDAGGALGVALFVWHQLVGHARHPSPRDSQRGSLLGPDYSSAQIRAELDALGARYEHHIDEHELLDVVAEQLAAERVVGFMHGRMEFGPRALGARSVLGDPRSPRMQSLMNLKIKFRESFRPFAPAVLEEHASEYFDVPEGIDSPYMLLVADVHPSQRIAVEEGLRGFARLGQLRSTIPAVTHVDGSARVQTVDARRNPRFRALLERFFARTGCPVLINTSFNVRGEPIVCTPRDAYRCFMGTDIDVLVVGDFVLWKERQPEWIGSRTAYHATFGLD
jgi:carbamoyltransferase